MANSNANGNNTEDSHTDGIQELSRLMLQGWTMLAEACPRIGCNMPLVRSRQGRMYCCQCRLDVVLPSSNGAGAAVNANGNFSADCQTTNGTAFNEEREEKVERNLPSPNRGDDNNNNGTPPSSTNNTAPVAAGDNGGPANFSNIGGSSSVPTESRMVVPTSNPLRSATLDDKLLQDWKLMHNVCGGPSSGQNPMLGNEPGIVSNVTGGPTSVVPSTLNTQQQHLSALNRPGSRPSSSTQLTPTSNAATTRNATTTAATATTSAAATAGHRHALPTPQQRPHTRIPAITGAPQSGLLTPVQQPNVDMDQNEIDVDSELRLAEIAAARHLKLLRCALPNTHDVETCKTITTAMTEAARTIEACRKALNAKTFL